MAYGEVITTSGGLYRTAQLVGAAYKYIGIGTGTDTPSPSDTSLQTQTQRLEGTVTITNNVVEVSKEFSFSGSYAITECGLFDASSGGNMFTRCVFAPKNVVNGDTLTVTQTLTFTEA